MKVSPYNDYFSTQAREYKKFRPQYPQELYEFLGADLKRDSVILDCATGNGQAALGMLEASDVRAIGIDVSFEQLSNAPTRSNCCWIRSSAEKLPIASASIDLAIVAQALHWFNFAKFFPEIKRVLKPGGRIAVWTYSLLAVCAHFPAPIECVIRWFYHEVVGEYWPAERRWVDDEYRSIPFPFTELRAPQFSIKLTWAYQDLVGYISSWSAVQLYAKQLRKSPLPLLENRLTAVWPAENYKISFAWPLALRLGR